VTAPVPHETQEQIGVVYTMKEAEDWLGL